MHTVVYYCTLSQRAQFEQYKTKSMDENIFLSYTHDKNIYKNMYAK